MKKLTLSIFYKNIYLLLSGTVLAQCITLISTIILQRFFYSPSEFGVFSLFFSTIGVYASVATLKYEYAIVSNSKDRDTFSLLVISLINSFFIAFLSIFCFLYLTDSISRNVLSESIGLKGLLILIFLTVFFTGTFDSLSFWHNNQERYKHLRSSKIIQAISCEGSRYGLFFVGFSHIGLVLSRIIGFGLSAVFLIPKAWKDNQTKLKSLTFKTLKTEYIKHKNFLFYTTPNVFVNNFCQALFAMLIIQNFGVSTLGFIGVANQYIAIPLGIISTSYAQVFFKKMYELESKKKLLNTYLSQLKKLLIISLIFIVLVLIMPGSLITYIFGEKWNQMIFFMKTASIWLSVSFVSSSLSFIYTRLEKQNIMFFYSIIQLGLTYFSIKIGSMYNFQIHTVYILYTVGQVVYYISTIFLALFFIKKSRLLHD